MTTYRIVRMFRDDHPSYIVAEGLTLAEAKKHCRDPETSSRTATGAEETELTERMGAWFDGFEEE